MSGDFLSSLKCDAYPQWQTREFSLWMITHREAALHKQEPQSMKKMSKGETNKFSDDESQALKRSKWELNHNTQDLYLLKLANPSGKARHPFVNSLSMLDNSRTISSDKGLWKWCCLQMKADETMLYPKTFYQMREARNLNLSQSSRKVMRQVSSLYQPYWQYHKKWDLFIYS